MSKDSCDKMCKYFGIDKVEVMDKSILHRQEKFINTYSGFRNPLCHSIFA